jgi:hypothetical protein
MRIGEAIRLDDDDLDVEPGVLAVTGKFGNYAEAVVMPSCAWDVGSRVGNDLKSSA